MGHKESKVAGVDLDDETIDRLTKNTNYTPEQIRQWHEAFLRDCPNGKLSPRQFTEVYKKFYPQHEAEKYSSQVFRTFDTDNNGYIDFVEFLVAVNVNANGDVRDKLGLAFDSYDMNSKEQVRIVSFVHIKFTQSTWYVLSEQSLFCTQTRVINP